MILTYMSNRIEKKDIISTNDYFLSSVLTFKSEILEELKNANFIDLDNDMVYRLQLTSDEILAIIDLKYVPSKIIGISLLPGIYEITDISITFNDIR